MNHNLKSKKVAKRLKELINRSEYQNVHRFCRENDVVTRQALARYIKGKQDITLGNLLDICDALKTDLTKILNHIKKS